MSENQRGPQDWAPATAPVTVDDTPVPLTMQTTVSELQAGDLFLPIRRGTLAMHIPIVTSVHPVDLDGMSIRAYEGERMHCVTLMGHAAGKLMPSRKVIFRAKRSGE